MTNRSAQYKDYIETYLKNFYGELHDLPQNALFDAMEYSLLAGGKRSDPFWPWNSAASAAVIPIRRLPLRQQWR